MHVWGRAFVRRRIIRVTGTFLSFGSAKVWFARQIGFFGGLFPQGLGFEIVFTWNGWCGKCALGSSRQHMVFGFARQTSVLWVFGISRPISWFRFLGWYGPSSGGLRFPQIWFFGLQSSTCFVLERPMRIISFAWLLWISATNLQIRCPGPGFSPRVPGFRVFKGVWPYRYSFGQLVLAMPFFISAVLSLFDPVSVSNKRSCRLDPLSRITKRAFRVSGKVSWTLFGGLSLSLPFQKRLCSWFSHLGLHYPRKSSLWGRPGFFRAIRFGLAERRCLDALRNLSQWPYSSSWQPVT